MKIIETACHDIEEKRILIYIDNEDVDKIM